jgi:hypothetical protein
MASLEGQLKVIVTPNMMSIALPCTSPSQNIIKSWTLGVSAVGVSAVALLGLVWQGSAW